MAPRRPARGAESPEDALAVCLAERGREELGQIGFLLGVPPTEAREQVGSRTWEDPASGEVVAASRYRSGHVRHKLEVAEAARATDPRWHANLEALRAVVPADLGPADIDARLGAPWIDPADVAAFAGEVLGCPYAEVSYEAVLGDWTVEARRVSLTFRVRRPSAS